MRLAIDSFRGEVPRLTPRALPANAAQHATNARLLTGDLEAWHQFALEKELANSAPILTIYNLNGAWLSWGTDVDVARGAIAGDTTFRTFLTGPDEYSQPRWTNYAMATSGAEPFPTTTRPLGVPAPDTTPTVVAGIDPNPTNFNVNIFDGGGELATNWTSAPFQDSHGGVTQVLEFGDLYQQLYDDNPGAPAYLYRNFGVASVNVLRESFDFEMTSGSENFYSMNAGVMRNQAGAGIAIGVSPGSFGLGAATGWSVIGQVGYVFTALSLAFDTTYTCEVQVVKNSDFTLTVTATIYQGSAQLAVLTTTNTFTTGDFCGFYTETSNNDGIDRYRTNVGNILVMGSGATGYVADNTATSYVYTFVNDQNEESAPSFASTTVLRPAGIAITVSTPPDVPTGIDSSWHIETKRIYRAVTGATGTIFRFVAEIPLTQTDFVDNVPDTELGEALESEGWALPPVNMRGILALPNSTMAGFSGNQLCLSAPNRPHAWPVANRYTVDTDVVAIGNIDTTVVIGTEAFPYLAIGTDPAGYGMTKLEVPQACVAKRGLAYLTGFGVVFPSPDGLIAISGNGAVQNLTGGVFTRKQWQALKPESILGVAHDDVYHFWYDNDVVPPPTGLWLDTFTGTAGTDLSDHAQDVPLGGSVWVANSPFSTVQPELNGSGSASGALSVDGFPSEIFTYYGGQENTGVALNFPFTLEMDFEGLWQAPDTETTGYNNSWLLEFYLSARAFNFEWVSGIETLATPATFRITDSVEGTLIELSNTIEGGQNLLSALFEADGLTVTFNGATAAKILLESVPNDVFRLYMILGSTFFESQRIAPFGTISRAELIGSIAP